MKKILALVLALLLGISCLVACSKKDEGEETSADTTTPVETTTDTDNGGTDEGPAEEVKPTTIEVNSSTAGFNILGERYIAGTKAINLDYAGSGIEFVADLKGPQIRFNFSVSGNCYFRAWVDGQEYTVKGNPLLKLASTGILALNDLPLGQHTIRLVKITDAAASRVDLKKVTISGTIITNAPVLADKDLYIEFIGDDYAVGKGLTGLSKGNYEDNDAALAYAYKTAMALNADYSIIAKSGQGAAGLADDYLKTSPIRDASAVYDFARKADVVVINIGTNDYANVVDVATFKASYTSLLNTVVAKNAGCKIVCLYNMINDTYAEAILEACEDAGGDSSGIVAHELDRDVNGVLTADEHTALATAIKGAIESHPGVFVPTLTIVPSGKGDDDSFNWG